MTTEPTYRQATANDAEAVLAIGHQLWDEMGERSGFTQRPTSEGIAPLLAGQGGAVFVCALPAGRQETGGSICGFSLLAPDLSDPEGAVMGVWLLPEARRKGIGRELALMATDHARTLGYKRLRGLIPKQNEPALSFFSDIGSLAQMVGQGMQYELPL
jgi:ribosomal protein S18 acetylase RimI-like enzyme